MIVMAEAILDIGSINPNGSVNARITRRSDMRSIECEIEDECGALTRFDRLVNGRAAVSNDLQPDAMYGYR